MTTFLEGNVLKLQCTFTVDGVPTDPTGVSLKVREPDGTISTYSYPTDISKTSTGVYRFNLAVDTHGNWWHRWEATGAVTAVDEEKIVVNESRF